MQVGGDSTVTGLRPMDESRWCSFASNGPDEHDRSEASAKKLQICLSASDIRACCWPTERPSLLEDRWSAQLLKRSLIHLHSVNSGLLGWDALQQTIPLLGLLID